MDRNSITGFILIFLILMVWQYTTAPTPEEIAEQRTRDSLAKIEQLVEEDNKIVTTGSDITDNQPVTQLSDSAKIAQASSTFGIFAPASAGTEQTYKLSNDLVEITFSNKGGAIKEVLLKEYHKLEQDTAYNQTKVPLRILEDKKNKFEYLLPVAGVGNIKSSDLYFDAVQNGNSITFSAKASNGKVFQQKYILDGDGYTCDYLLDFNGLESDFNEKNITLNWVNYLDKLELNTAYEKSYGSTVYYKEAEEDPTYCSCTSDDEETLKEKVKWVSNSNQFFNSTLLAENSFSGAELATTMLEEDASDLKKLTSRIDIPVSAGTVNMKFYNGPNEFNRLRDLDADVEDIIPFGWSIFGTINRWIIRPLFNFLSNFIGSKGIVILVLTVIVKLVLYPLTYKMIHSQSKMAVLKPEIAKMKEKYKDDSQQAQVETMKMYREYGVNPLGGCLPVVIQMPIWFALYRFFPSSIEFRQEAFLWANDLSSYDVFFRLPFDIMGYNHVSLFTMIWVFTTLIYTWYNSKLVDYSAQPAMKYMQYAMPVMFLFFFNNFASGLTAYLCMSNIFNILQTVVTKEYIIDKDKLRAGLEENKKKPKKKSGFQQRLEEAMKEQQRQQSEKKKKNRKK